MDAPEARKIIAYYLSGYQRVNREELHQAREAIKSDEPYLSNLREELGLLDDFVILCDVFAERAAEFCEMSEEERRDEMPDVAGHMNSCGSCRRLYWEIRPLWREQAVGAAGSLIRELGEHIRVAIDRAGWVREWGLGPPALQFMPGVTTLAGREEELPGIPGVQKRKEWLLQDEAADCDLKIVVEGQPGGGARVFCSIQPGPSRKVSAEQTRIEVRNAQTGSLILAGRLSDIEAEPINLPSGSWLMKLIAGSRHDSVTWNVPLELEAEPLDA